MENFLSITLILHIISGFTALLAGTLIAIFKKGDKCHRLMGKFFFFSMIGVAVSAVIISLAKNNQFLLLIGIFSFYLNLGGYRAIKNKSLTPSLADWLVLLLGATNGFFMIYSMNIVLMVFGGITVFIAIGQFRTNLKVLRKQEIHKMEWLKRHIGMMTGAFIATVTAFVVVNIRLGEDSLIPAWFPWLAPTAILVPLLTIWTRKYTGPKKKADGNRGL